MRGHLVKTPSGTIQVSTDSCEHCRESHLLPLRHIEGKVAVAGVRYLYFAICPTNDGILLYRPGPRDSIYCTAIRPSPDLPRFESKPDRQHECSE